MDHERNWTLRLPVALIVGALMALVVVPYAVQQRTGRLAAHRDEVAQPARDLVNTIQRSLAREMGALRGFVITEDEAFLDRYEEALQQEQQAYRELEPLAIRLGPDVEAALQDLRRRADRWHGRATEAEILSRQLVPEEFIDRIRSEEVRYEQTLAAAEVLRERILFQVEVNREAIDATERASLVATTALAFLAAAAALVALWLGRRLRTLAVAADQRRREVERVSENRARLIRGITHDLKNPLGGARGHLQLMESGIVDDPDRRRHSIERADRAIGTALDIIQDLLDLSRAEAGELPVAIERVDLRPLVVEAIEDQEGTARRGGLRLEIEEAHGIPPIHTDPRRVREVVRNLVSNALKYTPPGGTVRVRLRADGRPSAPHRHRVAVDVIDDGPGIPEKDREKIFGEFTRLSDTEQEAGGTGLGLTISRQIARMLGGDVTVVSELGRGSVFTLELPVRPAPPTA